MTNPLTTLVPEHQLVTSSTSNQRNHIENVARCTCGSVDLNWYERELEHARHVLDVVRAEAIAGSAARSPAHRTASNEPPTAEVRGCDLAPGDVLVGDSAGRSLINEVAPSSSMPGLLCLETEHGPLYLDPDETYLVIDEDGQAAGRPDRHDQHNS